MINLSPTFEGKWAEVRQWPVGVRFCAVEIGDDTYVWGGHQMQPNGDWKFLPRDVVYVFNSVEHKWRMIKATGDIPSCSVAVAAVACGGIIYFFGGRGAGGNLTNEFSTNDVFSFLPASARFTRLRVAGVRPAPRVGHRGWAVGDKLIFFAGETVKVEVGDKRLLVSGEHDGYRDNLLMQFDTMSNTWSALETVGPRPPPLYEYAAAIHGDIIVIQGGWRADGVSGDTHSLNTATLTWTKIPAKGPESWCHSLSAISPTRLLLIGGDPSLGINISGKVWILDTRDSTWQEAEPIPAGFGDGLKYHHAVVTKTPDGASVICLGGCVDKNRNIHPKSMLIFDIE